MRIVKFTAGRLCTNHYLVIGAEDRAVLIDCGGTPEEVFSVLRRESVSLDAILLTHGHVDHIFGLDGVVAVEGCPVYLHPMDHLFLSTPVLNLSEVVYRKTHRSAVTPLMANDNEMIEAAGLSFQVLHTPGHTPGSVCYRIGEHLFTGDTLFCDSIGAIFGPAGNQADEIDSIRTRLFTLDQDLRCHPGHGEDTGLFYERRCNPYCGV